MLTLPSILRTLVAALCAFCLLAPELGLAASKREKEQPPLPPPPPQPVPQNLKVKRGEKIDVTLKIFGSQTQPLRFLIREGPDSGKLSEPRGVTRETAVVTYEPPADVAVTKARFFYAVQNTLGVSAPAEVAISIMDDPVRLVVPNSIEFPALQAGGKAVKELEIVNRGGGAAEGRIEADAPWRIDGDPGYRLGAGELKRFSVTFEPEASGKFRGEIRYSSQRDRVTALAGEAEAALSARPSPVELRHAPGELLRTAALEVLNHTDRSQEVTLKADDRIHAPERIEVPAHGAVSVTLQASPDDVRPIRAAITVEGAGVKLSLPVQAAAVGPVLRAPKSVRLAGGSTTAPAHGSVTLENAGGAEGFWKWEIAAPFRAEPAEARLRPGEKQTVALLLDPSEPGPYRSWLSIAGESQSLEVAVEAFSQSSAAAPAKPSSASAPRRVSPSGSRPSVTRVREEAANDPRAEPGVPPPPPVDVKTSHVTSTSLVLSWPASAASAAKGYRIERRALAYGEGKALKVKWEEASPKRLSMNGSEVVAELTGLPPDIMHVIRVRPVGADGAVGGLLFISEIPVPEKKPWFDVSPLQALGAALAVCLAALGWRRFRASRRSSGAA